MLNDTLSPLGVNADRRIAAAGPHPSGQVSSEGEDEPEALATAFAALFAQTSAENGSATAPSNHDGATPPSGDADARSKATAPPERTVVIAATEFPRSPGRATAQESLSLQTDTGQSAALASTADPAPTTKTKSSAPSVIFASRAIAAQGGSGLPEAAPPQTQSASDTGRQSKGDAQTDVGGQHARGEASISIINEERASPDAASAILSVASPATSHDATLAPALPGQPAVASDTSTVNQLSPLAAPHAPDLFAAAIETSPAQSSPSALVAPEIARSGEAASAFRIALIVKTDDHDFELRLDPPNLGSVILRFLEDESGAQLTLVTAENRETLDLLRRHADVLQRELSRAGVGDLQLDFLDPGEGDRGFEDRPTNRRIRFGETIESLVAETGATMIAPGRIDRFA